MTMEIILKSHTVHDQLPWPQKGKGSRYQALHDALEEDVGKWHVFELAEGISPENARGAVISYAKTHDWEVTTSKNGLRLGVLRKR